MKILDRYLLTALGVATLMGVALLSLVLVLGNVFKEMLDLLINHNVPLETIFAFVAFVLPFSMTFTIPWGFLTAVLLVFGRLSAAFQGFSFPCSPWLCFWWGSVSGSTSKWLPGRSTR